MLYLVPTRGRPHKAAELVAAWEATTEKAQLTFVLDGDDPKLDEYVDVLEELDWSYIRIDETDRVPGMVQPLNVAAAMVGGHVEYVGFMGDDHRPRTPGWDTKLRLAMVAERAAIGYGDDLMQRANLPTAALIDYRVYQALGYMAPPELRHLYVDNWWKAIGQGAGRLIYVDYIVIEHMHPAAGKAEWDEDYIRVNAGEMYQRDSRTYEALLHSGAIGRDIDKVRKIFD